MGNVIRKTATVPVAEPTGSKDTVGLSSATQDLAVSSNSFKKKDVKKLKLRLKGKQEDPLMGRATPETLPPTPPASPLPPQCAPPTSSRKQNKLRASTPTPKTTKGKEQQQKRRRNTTATVPTSKTRTGATSPNPIRLMKSKTKPPTPPPSSQKASNPPTEESTKKRPSNKAKRSQTASAPPHSNKTGAASPPHKQARRTTTPVPINASKQALLAKTHEFAALALAKPMKRDSLKARSSITSEAPKKRSSTPTKVNRKAPPKAKIPTNAPRGIAAKATTPNVAKGSPAASAKTTAQAAIAIIKKPQTPPTASNDAKEAFAATSKTPQTPTVSFKEAPQKKKLNWTLPTLKKPPTVNSAKANKRTAWAPPSLSPTFFPNGRITPPLAASTQPAPAWRSGRLTRPSGLARTTSVFQVGAQGLALLAQDISDTEVESGHPNIDHSNSHRRASGARRSSVGAEGLSTLNEDMSDSGSHHNHPNNLPSSAPTTNRRRSSLFQMQKTKSVFQMGDNGNISLVEEEEDSDNEEETPKRKSKRGSFFSRRRSSVEKLKAKGMPLITEEAKPQPEMAPPELPTNESRRRRSSGAKIMDALTPKFAVPIAKRNSTNYTPMNVKQAMKIAPASKWKVDTIQFSGRFDCRKMGKWEEVKGKRIDKGIKKFKAHPEKYLAITYQHKMRFAANTKSHSYTLIHREGTFPIRPMEVDPQGPVTLMMQQYQHLSSMPNNELPIEHRDGHTYDMEFDGEKLHSSERPPILPGRGMGAGDSPNLKIIGDIDPSDIVQGEVGNCWMLSAISALAEFDGAIKRLFRKTEYLDYMPMDGPNKYTITLYDLTTWEEVDIVVDESLAAHPYRPNELLGAQISEDGELWVSYLEKAFVVHCGGGWNGMEGGHATHAWSMMTGCKEQYFIRKNYRTGKFHCSAKYDMFTKQWKKLYNLPRHEDTAGLEPIEWPEVGGGGCMGLEITADELFTKMYAWDQEDYIVGASSKGTLEEDISAGLVRNHCYSVIDALHNVAGTGIDLFKIRNPWGHTEMEDGQFHDTGPGWEKYPQIKALLKPVVANDGIFYLTKDEFFDFFDHIYLSACNMSQFKED